MAEQECGALQVYGQRSLIKRVLKRDGQAHVKIGKATFYIYTGAVGEYRVRPAHYAQKLVKTRDWIKTVTEHAWTKSQNERKRDAQ